MNVEKCAYLRPFWGAVHPILASINLYKEL